MYCDAKPNCFCESHRLSTAKPVSFFFFQLANKLIVLQAIGMYQVPRPPFDRRLEDLHG